MAKPDEAAGDLSAEASAEEENGQSPTKPQAKTGRLLKGNTMGVQQRDGYLKALCSFLAGKLLSVCKLSFVLGSQAVFFSASNLSMPLIGFFGGAGTATAVWVSLLAWRFAVGAFSLSTLAFYIPGYAAALYLATRSRLVRCGIPLCAAALFLAHPVGLNAALYSCYWLIPCLIGMGAFRSFFVQALGATFTAHAVGSVIWLYTVPMTPETWLGLIPIVAVERLTFAAGMVVMQAVITHAITLFTSLFSKFTKQSAFLTR